MDTIDLATKHSAVSISTAAKQLSKLTTITLPQAWVEAVTILFAPGHVLLTGVRLKYAGNVILPYNGVGSFIFGDNERLAFDIGMYMPGLITIETTNTDTVGHAHIVTFRWHTWKPDAPPALVPIPLVVV